MKNVLINIYDEAGNLENLCLQPKQHVHIFPRYCTQENISRRLHLITYSHNPFCNVPHITFHYTQAKTTLCNRKMHLQPRARQSPPPQVSPFFFPLDFYFLFVMVIPWHGRAGARETQIMQNPTRTVHS